MIQPEPTELLQNILILEAQKHYADNAVIGGLDAYLTNATPLLPRWFAPMADRVRHAAGGYRGWSREKRAEWVTAALKLLRNPHADGPPPELQPITTLTRVSTRTALLFARLGVYTLNDLLYLLPRRYLDYTQRRTISELQPYAEQTVVGRVLKAYWTYPGKRRSTEAIIGDHTGTVRMLWFNQPWMAKKLPTDREIVVSGMVSVYQRHLQFSSPEWEELESSGIHTGRLVPVHPLTQGISAKAMRTWVTEALDLCAPGPAEYLHRDILERSHFPPLSYALRQVHFPDSIAHASAARQRLAFDELLSLQLGLLLTRKHWQCNQPGRALKAEPALKCRLQELLPFTLTKAQEQALGEVMQDMSRPVPMSRLLQGDVGSGKTIVALTAMVITAAHKLQAALMAPTEVLAEQHFRTLLALLSGGSPEAEIQTTVRSRSLRDDPVQRVEGVLQRPLTVALLTGSLSASNRRRVRSQLAAGEIDLVVGTQALVQKGVDFQSLALAIVDEQHRFGVLQRGELRQKGYNPHVLVMTATPIPRSLALTMYGDLDLSIIDMLPPGRQEITTRVFNPVDIHIVYARIRDEIDGGHQAYVICPLISESDKLAARAATEEHQHLSRDIFPDLRLGLLHGALRPAEKDIVMRQFRDGELDVLVSTTVIEVGIDVPNATVMAVLGADRFGLSQLHQLRGRVGRGSEKSYCFLVGDTESPEAMSRLRALQATNDGFELAMTDLKMRGAGDFLGTQQSGLPPLKVATLTDLSTIEKARTEAQTLICDDRLIIDPMYDSLRERVAALWNKNVEWS